MDIHQIFQGKAIGETWSIQRGVCIADDIVVALGHKVRETTTDDIGHTASHFSCIRWIDLEGSCAMQNVMSIDFGNRSDIRILCLAYLNPGLHNLHLSTVDNSSGFSRYNWDGLMDILGVSAFYHDSAACLVRDGQILAAAQEERFTRRKHDAGFPGHAIRYCLHEAHCALTDLQYIVFYDKPL